MQLVQLALIRPVVARSISKLALPKLPSVHSNLWHTHASYNGTDAQAAATSKGFVPHDYERLEVRSPHRLEGHECG